jgi:hypothetical protein
MLSTTLVDLVAEIEAAEKFRDEHLEHYHRTVSRYAGSAYRRWSGNGPRDLANFSYEYLSLMLPRIAFDRPTVAIKAGTLEQEAVATRLKHALDRWMRMVKFRSTARRLATDMLIGGYGVGLVVSEPRYGHRDIDDTAPYLPRVYRLSPGTFFADPAATHPEEWRYAGHVWTIDLDELRRKAETDKTWNRVAIEGLQSEQGIDEVRRDVLGDTRDIPIRHQVAIYELWIPEVHPDLLADPATAAAAARGEVTGTIYTLIKAGGDGTDAIKEGFLRQPQPFRGPRSGPYVQIGVYDVPEDPYPLSPLVAVLPQVDDFEAALNTQHQGAVGYKRFAAIDAAKKTLQRDIKNMGSEYILSVEGLAPGVIQMLEVGGITQQQLLHTSVQKERLDRTSGMSDALRGNVSGDATATEVQVAEGSASMRTADVGNQFTAAIADVLTRVAWHLWHDDRVEFPLGLEAARALGDTNPLWSKNVRAGEFDDLDLEIEPYSMQRVSAGVLQARALQLFEIIERSAVGMGQAPKAPWSTILSLIGGMLNVPNLPTLVGASNPMAFAGFTGTRGGGRDAGPGPTSPAGVAAAVARGAG